MKGGGGRLSGGGAEIRMKAGVLVFWCSRMPDRKKSSGVLELLSNARILVFWNASGSGLMEDWSNDFP